MECSLNEAFLIAHPLEQAYESMYVVYVSMCQWTHQQCGGGGFLVLVWGQTIQQQPVYLETPAEGEEGTQMFPILLEFS